MPNKMDRELMFNNNRAGGETGTGKGERLQTVRIMTFSAISMRGASKKKKKNAGIRGFPSSEIRASPLKVKIRSSPCSGSP